MKKITKGAIAAAAAAAVLMGGAGSLAYWTDAQTVSGAAIESGHLSLDTDDINSGCAGWKLDDGTAIGADTLLVPGDTLTETCTFTLKATGEHMAGALTASAPAFAGEFLDVLQPTISGVTLAGAPATSFTEADNGKAVGLTVTITFPGEASGNNTQDLTDTLSDIAITVTQQHDA